MMESEKTFTEALTALQRAANEIGKQTTTLEESIRLFEEGMKEAEFCNAILDGAAQKISIYGEKTE